MDLRKKCRRPRSRSNVEKNEVKALAATKPTRGGTVK